MIEQALSSLDAYVAYFNQHELPVLKKTQRALAELRAREDTVSGKEIAHLVLQDPLMTLKVLAYIEAHRGRRQNHDITTIGHAIMMLGITPFFREFDALPTVEERLKAHPQALLGVVKVIARARRAAQWARDWAALRHDMDVDEITVATLLHDCAEVLCWVFAPKPSLQLRSILLANPGMRSAEVQAQVFGVTAHDLQLALARHWKLPELLVTLMGDTESDNPRVRTVRLALGLARHAQHGWDDPALPDDYAELEQLLRLSRENVLLRIGAPIPPPSPPPSPSEVQP